MPAEHYIFVDYCANLEELCAFVDWFECGGVSYFCFARHCDAICPIPVSVARFLRKYSLVSIDTNLQNDSHYLLFDGRVPVTRSSTNAILLLKRRMLYCGVRG